MHGLEEKCFKLLSDIFTNKISNDEAKNISSELLKQINQLPEPSKTIIVKRASEIVDDYIDSQVEKVATEVKRYYESLCRRVFSSMNKNTIAEIYETAICLTEELMSCVYFLRNKKTDLLKIGYATNLPRRMSQIKSAFRHIGYDDPLQLEAIHLCFQPHVSVAEKYFHTDFAEDRILGEWFDISHEELWSYLVPDLEGGIIDDVIVSFGDYESLLFNPITKDYTIESNQLKSNLIKEYLPRYKLEYFLSSEVKNKFYKIIKIVEESKTNIFGYDYSTLPISKRGLAVKGAHKDIDFMGLKREKFNEAWTSNTVQEVNKLLAREEAI